MSQLHIIPVDRVVVVQPSRKQRKVSFAAVALLSAATYGIIAAPARADDSDVVDYRQHIMSTLDDEVQAIEQIGQHHAPAEGLPAHLRSLSLTAATVLKAFTAPVPGGHAKPELWKGWTDFRSRADHLVESAKALEAQGSQAPLTADLFSSLGCRGCHETYRLALPAKATAGPTLPDEVRYRRLVMAILNEQAQALGQIFATTVLADNAALHMQTIASTAGTALQAFQPKVPGGEAKAALWDDWTNFAKDMSQFAIGTAAAAGLLQSKGWEASQKDVSDSLTCKACHDRYRDYAPE